jgi:D-lyxose ketol-isomerase
MLTAKQLSAARKRTAANLKQAGIVLTPAEAAAVELTAVGLGRFDAIGLALVVYVNSDRCCSKQRVLLPRQNFPEHRRPPPQQVAATG